MKSFYMLLFFIAISPLAKSQILNGDFESWQNYFYYEDPTGWFTNNSSTSKLGILTVLKDDSEVYSGRYAADLVSQKLPLGGTLPGFMFLGSSLFPDMGQPFNQRPTSFSAWFEYVPSEKDTCIFTVTLTRRNPVTHLRDTVAISSFNNGATFRYYVNFISPFIYYQTEDPDTMHIYISSSSLPAPPPGSLLRVDNLTLNGLTGIPSVNKPSAITYYPNPVKDRLNIILSNDEKVARVNVYDLSGKTEDAEPVSGKSLSLNVSPLRPGVYFFEVIGKNGTLLKTDRFEKIN